MTLLQELISENSDIEVPPEAHAKFKEALRKATDAFKANPSKENLDHLIKIFNDRPGDEPRIQGWKVV